MVLYETEVVLKNQDATALAVRSKPRWLWARNLNLQNTRQPALGYLQITLVAGPGFEPTNALVKSMILVVCGPPQPPERCQLKRFGSISMRRRQNRGTAQLELVWHRQHSNTEDIFVSVPRIRNHPDGQPLASNCRSNPARWDPLPHNVGFGGGMRNLHCGSVDA